MCDYDDLLKMKERAAHCLHFCDKRGKANCFECENQVTLEKIIELCDMVDENWFYTLRKEPHQNECGYNR